MVSHKSWQQTRRGETVEEGWSIHGHQVEGAFGTVSLADSAGSPPCAALLCENTMETSQGTENMGMESNWIAVGAA
jgi:hypothetical protein